MARRGENIRKRSDGRWEGRYIKGRSADGKPCWGYVYGATYAEVREISIRKKAEYGIYNLNGTDITFKEISEQWLYSVRQSVKESTFRTTSILCGIIFCPSLDVLRQAHWTKRLWNRDFLKSSRQPAECKSLWVQLWRRNVCRCCGVSANMRRICISFALWKSR